MPRTKDWNLALIKLRNEEKKIREHLRKQAMTEAKELIQGLEIIAADNPDVVRDAIAILEGRLRGKLKPGRKAAPAGEGPAKGAVKAGKKRKTAPAPTAAEIRTVLSKITKSKQSITDIAKEANIAWGTTRKALGALGKDGKVQGEGKGGGAKYWLAE